MQGVLVVSSNTAIRKSLVAVLQDGRMVRDCRTLSECLHFAASEKLDLIVIDDVFEDGTADELVARLHALGYGFEMVPLLLNCEPINTRPFQSYGVRFFLEKPFKINAVQSVVAQVEEMARLSQTAMDYARESMVRGNGDGHGGGMGHAEPDTSSSVDVREVSQRFRRLLARLQSREDLVSAFADSLQEQFDVDNVVVLLPATGRPMFEVVAGTVAPEIRQQFFIPLDEPLVRSLVRLGEPVWVHECERLGRENAVTAIRYGERLNIQVLCPVLSRGRLRALVGLSRFHRYQNSLELVSLLRLFLTFFAEALDNAELYEKAATAGEVYRGMVDALPVGAFAVGAGGRISHVNPRACQMLGLGEDELVEQPVERAGSLIAHCVRTALDTDETSASRELRVNGVHCRVQASRIHGGSGCDGAVVTIDEIIPVAPAGSEMAPAVEAVAFDQRLWDDMTRAVAHNFKNSFVPVQTCAELLPQRFQEESFRTFFLQTVRENIGRINQWIDQLLSFSRLEEESDWGNLSVNEILGRVLDEVVGQFPETHLNCSRELNRNDTVRGCPSVLERMFREVVRNAVEAVQDVPAPQVVVRSAEDDGRLVVEVLDNGAGFDEVPGRDPVRPFSSGKLSGNLGLGLAYAHRAALMHNGNLELGRETGGARTAVRVTLPLVKAASTHPKATVEKETSPTQHSLKKERTT